MRKKKEKKRKKNSRFFSFLSSIFFQSGIKRKILSGTLGLRKDFFAKSKGKGGKGNYFEAIIFETCPLAKNNGCGFP